MNTTLLLIVIALMALCVLLLKRITKLEYQVYDLNDKLNLSDMEYLDLFDINLDLSLQVENFAKTRISENNFIKETEKIT